MLTIILPKYFFQQCRLPDTKCKYTFLCYLEAQIGWVQWLWSSNLFLIFQIRSQFQLFCLLRFRLLPYQPIRFRRFWQISFAFGSFEPKLWLFDEQLLGLCVFYRCLQYLRKKFLKIFLSRRVTKVTATSKPYFSSFFPSHFFKISKVKQH